VSYFEPSVWNTVVELIGEELSTTLSATMGGSRLYVPRYIGPHHPIAVTVGEKAAAVLAAKLSGEFILVPVLLGRHARIVQMKASGARIDDIAMAVGCARRTVFEHLAQEREANGVQLDLFGDL
jgi:hypothetical protein